MANPGGTNQFGGFSKERPYGAVGRLQRLSKAAPMSGTPVLNAPKQAQRKAVRGRPSPEAAPLAPPPVQPTYKAQLAAVWGELSGYTQDALVQEYAAIAARQAQT